MFARFIHDRSGATAVEYGLMAVMFVLGIIGAWTHLGNSIDMLFSDTANMFNNAVNN